jgi:hypothetical protein
LCNNCKRRQRKNSSCCPSETSLFHA